MKWLRECFAEYARHPLPTFIGVAIIGASLITAAMAFITRHPASEPAPLSGSTQSVTPAAPSTRAPRPSRPPERQSPASPSAPAAQPETAAPQIRAADAGTRGLRTVCILMAGRIMATMAGKIMATSRATAPGLRSRNQREFASTFTVGSTGRDQPDLLRH